MSYQYQYFAACRHMQVCYTYTMNHYYRTLATSEPSALQTKLLVQFLSFLIDSFRKLSTCTLEV